MTNKINFKLLFYAILFILLIFSIFFYGYSLKISSVPIDNQEDLKVSTDKQEYGQNEKSIIVIENVSEKKACFSSCYPFFVQKQESTWRSYEYETCPKENIAEVCINPYGKKAFEVILEDQGILAGNYRFIVSACTKCNVGDRFETSEVFFSNEFKVK
jgi:hypothetical protein